MKYIFISGIFLLKFLTVFSQLRYSDPVFQNIDTIRNVEYARAAFLNNPIGILAPYNIHDGENRTAENPLFMDIFMPQGDTLKKRPAIVFAHSGAFLIGSRLADDMVAFCDSFARKGFVTATIDYRMGMGADVSRFLGLVIQVQITPYNGYRAVYRAAQDAHAAIRFLKHNATEFGIDTSRIFFAGSSAGGILGLCNIYYDRINEWDSTIVNHPDLGGIDEVGIPGYGGKANALVSMWGAVQNTAVIENDSTPVLLIHGTADPVVPFKKGVPLAGIIPDNPVLGFSMPETLGSFCIDTALTNRNIPHQSYFSDGGIHEFYGTDTGEFPEEGPNPYWDTIQNKINGFFFDLLKPEASFEFIADNLTLRFSDTSEAARYSFWDFGDGATGAGKVVEHAFPAPGTFRVKLTTCNEIMACDTISHNIDAGLPVFYSTNREMNLSVFPNPAGDQIFIRGIEDKCTVRICDLSGRTCLLTQVSGNLPVDLSTLPRGIYLLRIQTNSSDKIVKLIKK